MNQNKKELTLYLMVFAVAGSLSLLPHILPLFQIMPSNAVQLLGTIGGLVLPAATFVIQHLTYKRHMAEHHTKTPANKPSCTSSDAEREDHSTHRSHGDTSLRREVYTSQFTLIVHE